MQSVKNKKKNWVPKENKNKENPKKLSFEAVLSFGKKEKRPTSTPNYDMEFVKVHVVPTGITKLIKKINLAKEDPLRKDTEAIQFQSSLIVDDNSIRVPYFDAGLYKKNKTVAKFYISKKEWEGLEGYDKYKKMVNGIEEEVDETPFEDLILRDGDCIICTLNPKNIDKKFIESCIYGMLGNLYLSNSAARPGYFYLNAENATELDWAITHPLVKIPNVLTSEEENNLKSEFEKNCNIVDEIKKEEEYEKIKISKNNQKYEEQVLKDVEMGKITLKYHFFKMLALYTENKIQLSAEAMENAVNFFSIDEDEIMIKLSTPLKKSKILSEEKSEKDKVGGFYLGLIPGIREIIQSYENTLSKKTVEIMEEETETKKILDKCIRIEHIVYPKFPPQKMKSNGQIDPNYSEVLEKDIKKKRSTINKEINRHNYDVVDKKIGFFLDLEKNQIVYTDNQEGSENNYVATTASLSGIINIKDLDYFFLTKNPELFETLFAMIRINFVLTTIKRPMTFFKEEKELEGYISVISAVPNLHGALQNYGLEVNKQGSEGCVTFVAEFFCIMNSITQSINQNNKRGEYSNKNPLLDCSSMDEFYKVIKKNGLKITSEIPNDLSTYENITLVNETEIFMPSLNGLTEMFKILIGINDYTSYGDKVENVTSDTDFHELLYWFYKFKNGELNKEENGITENWVYYSVRKFIRNWLYLSLERARKENKDKDIKNNLSLLQQKLKEINEKEHKKLKDSEQTEPKSVLFNDNITANDWEEYLINFRVAFYQIKNLLCYAKRKKTEEVKEEKKTEENKSEGIKENNEEKKEENVKEKSRSGKKKKEEKSTKIDVDSLFE